MKIYYDKKTDFMAITFESEIETYADECEGGYDIVKAEDDDRVVGYNLYNARTSIIEFSEVTSKVKFAMFMKMYRKRKGLTQEDLFEQSHLPLATIKSLESGNTSAGIESITKVKAILQEIDMNAVTSNVKKVG
ncbi:MAG: helix-turn-helix domain-containing protein [Bacteriovoracaceae bacterium]|jgi:DNA-binding XRE family transcriptional regulator|nr:helix-turn-helix domain-containing protein [Bacteriovoracaceae bacterium]